MCGDATNSCDIEKLMKGDKARLIATDPPYNVGYHGKTKIRERLENDFMSKQEFEIFLEKAIGNMVEHSLPGTPFYIFMASSSFETLQDIMRKLGLKWSTNIIWAKDCFVLSWADYHQQYEPLWYGWKSGAPRLHPVKDRTQSNLWHIKRPKKNPLHPTQKPTELLKRIIKNSSEEGDIVLDLFGGSGSTLKAANELNRKCYIMEINPEYCQSIIDSIVL